MEAPDDIVKISRIGDVSVVLFSKRRLLHTEITDAIKQHLFTLAGEKDGKLIVDLGGVEYISSTVVNTLVQLSQMLEHGRGKLCICHVPPAIEQLFEISECDKALAIFNSGEDALEHLETLSD